MTRAASGTWALKRAGNRAWREVVAKVPAVDRRHSRRLRAYRDQLAPLPPVQHRLVEDLVRNGVTIVDLDSLGLSGTAALKEPLERLVQGLGARVPSTEPHSLCAGRVELLDEIGLWQWGLREDVLNLVERYLQLPARYYGPDVRREVADGQQWGVRQWHRDTEDHRVLRMLVWIHDVGPMGGAFEWIPPDLTVAAARELGYVSGWRATGGLRWTERQMANVVSREQWRRADGPRWTAVFADTNSVFHRAGTPRYKDRYSVTFTWTSRWPLKTHPTKRFTPAETAKVQQGLNSRQLAALPPELLAR